MKHLAVICTFVVLSALCQGSDAVRSATANRYQRARLTGRPENLGASEITLTSVKLTWSYTGPDEASYYVIYYRPTSTRQGYSQIPRITSTEFDVQNLSPYTEYQFIVVAVSNGRRSARSEPVIVTTSPPRAAYWDTTTESYQLEETTSSEAAWGSWGGPWDPTTTTTTESQQQQEGLPEPPEHLRVAAITNSSVELVWSYTGTDDLLYYVIYYKPRHTREPYSEATGIVSTYSRISSLWPNTEYVFLVVGFNAIGRGLPSAPVFVTTNRNGIPDGSFPSWVGPV